MRLTQLATLLVLLLFAAACGSESSTTEPSGTDAGTDAANQAPEQAISPGTGFRVDAKELHLGHTFATLKQAFGAPPRLRDLGPLGFRFGYPDLHVSGMLSGSGDDAEVTSLTADPGFDEGAAEKQWMGIAESDLSAALGEAVRDPFLALWWYRGAGAAFEVEGGKVVGVTVFAAGD